MGFDTSEEVNLIQESVVEKRDEPDFCHASYRRRR
jgi:hypothetical protein